MYRHILIPTDGSQLSELAIRQGTRLAKSIGAKVTAITVFPPFHTIAIEPMMVTDTAEQYQMECDALGEKYFRVVKDAAKAADVPCEVVQVIHDHPYQAIIETANTRGCDLIFMASHGRRGMAALVLGSETTKVLTHTRIPVLVCRGRSPRTSHRSDEGGAPRRIFHPTDFPRRRGPRSIRRWPWLGAPGPSCSSST